MDNIQQNIFHITWIVKKYWDEYDLEDIPYHELEGLIDDFAKKFETIHPDKDWNRLDYSEEIEKYTNKCLARELWNRFGDVPMNPETEEIECYWNGFDEGTHREEIWHWFEETFRVSVAEDLMHV